MIAVCKIVRDGTSLLKREKFKFAFLLSHPVCLYYPFHHLIRLFYFAFRLRIYSAFYTHTCFAHIRFMPEKQNTLSIVIEIINLGT